MKTRSILLTLAILALAILAACSGSPEPTPEQAPENVPSFFLNPPVADDAIYGVGSARMSTLDSSRRLALSRAREDIAFQMQATIEAAIIDYAQEAGADGNTQVVSFVETISRQVTETTLQGARTEEVAQGSDGTVYALLSYPRNEFQSAAAGAFERNQDAAFAEFQAEQALEYLDSQLSNAPTQSGSQN